MELIIGTREAGLELVYSCSFSVLLSRGPISMRQMCFFSPTTNVISITVLCWWRLIDVFSLVQSALGRVNFLSTFQRILTPLKTGICNELRQFSSQLECLSRLSSPILLPLPLVRPMNFHEGQTLYFRLKKQKAYPVLGFKALEWE